MFDKKAPIEKFVEEYGLLTKKYGVDFAAFPQFIPDGNSGFKIICQVVPIDLKEQKGAELNKAFISK